MAGEVHSLPRGTAATVLGTTSRLPVEPTTVRRTTLAGPLALLLLAAAIVAFVAIGVGLLGERATSPSPDVADEPGADTRPSGTPADVEPATVVRIVDGDTIRVDVVGRAGDVRVRLLNVDAPELDHPERGPECGARTATEALAALLPIGSTVWLAADREEVDRYGRWLRYAYNGEGVDVQAALVEAGLAEVLVVGRNDRFAGGLRPLARSAQRDELGIWGAACPA